MTSIAGQALEEQPVAYLWLLGADNGDRTARRSEGRHAARKVCDVLIIPRHLGKDAVRFWQGIRN